MPLLTTRTTPAMRALSVSGLAERLRTDTVSQKEQMWYLMVWVIGYALLSCYVVMDALTTHINHWAWISDAVIIITSIAGTYLCYRTNRRGDNRAFVERYICLAFPVLCQTVLLSIPIVAAVVWYMLEFVPDFESSGPMAADAVLTLFLSLFYYSRLNAGMRKSSAD